MQPGSRGQVGVLCFSRYFCYTCSSLGDTVEEQAQLAKCLALLQGPLEPENYAERFQLLLHMEQWQEQRDIRLGSCSCSSSIIPGTLTCLK